MKKETILGIAVVTLILVAGLLVWRSQPRQALLGTWQGDGTMEVLGDTPFDGAERLEFCRDGTGIVTSRGTETDFVWSIAPAGTQDLLVLQAGEMSYGRHFSVKGGRLTLYEDGMELEFIRK